VTRYAPASRRIDLNRRLIKKAVAARLCRLRLMHGRHPQSYSRFHSLRYRSIQAVEGRKVKEILVSSFAYTRVLRSSTRATNRDNLSETRSVNDGSQVTALGGVGRAARRRDRRVDLIGGSIAKTPRVDRRAQNLRPEHALCADHCGGRGSPHRDPSPQLDS
jgi:hypothetical protein